MRLKTEGYRIELLVGCRLIPNNINDPIFTIFIVCAAILSAVEGLNGFKKLNIKDIDLNKTLVKTLEVHKYFRVKGSP